MRLPFNNIKDISVDAQQQQQTQTETQSNRSMSRNRYREAYLIRKASDYASSSQVRKSGLFGALRDNDRNKDGGVGGTSAGWMNPGKLAEGIGIDARQYIESLLSLNR